MTPLLLLVAWLLTYLVHSTVLLGGAWLLVRVALVRSNQARDVLWKAALVGGLLTATSQVALHLEPRVGHFSLTSREASALIVVAGVPAPSRAGAAGDAAAATLPAGREEEAVARPAREAARARPLLEGVHVGFPALLVHFWLIGALAFTGCLIAARRRLNRRLATRRPLTRGRLHEMLQELSAAARVRVPRLSVSPELSGPIAFGRAEICLPEQALVALTPLEQRAMLAHELGHLVRRDPQWLVFAAAVESVLFFQPLNRLARRRLSEVSEYWCDDWAAALAGSGEVLARCLAQVAGWMGGEARPALVAGMAESRSQLVRRVQRLLDGRWGAPGAEGRGQGRGRVRARAWPLLICGVAIAGVAWSVPGVTAGAFAAPFGAVEEAGGEWDLASAAWQGDPEAWVSVRERGRVLLIHASYAARVRGSGRLGFRQWGRGFEVPEGYSVAVNGERVTADREVCAEDEVLTIVDPDGRTAWVLEPMPLVPYAGRHGEAADGMVAEAMSRVRVRVEDGGLTVDIDTSVFHRDLDPAQEAEQRLDVVLDSLVELWISDPEAVRAAARRIARHYDAELKPRLESLGTAVGRELAPQLERLTASMARDLTPEFARLGAELGRMIVLALGDPDSLAEERRPGARDYREPKGQKHR
jgi:Zn-dependent protease with chaperone function